MNDKLKLISNLLTRYYDGSATPAETTMLRQMLDSLSDSELTADLRLERDLLRAMSESAQALEPDIPDNLEARLIAATVGTESAPKAPRRRWARIYRVAAVAASVVLVLGIAWRFIGSHDNVAIGSDDNIVAQVTELSDTVVTTATDIAARPVESAPASDEAKPAPAVTRRIAPRPRHAHVASASAFKEVTDTAEAVRLTLKVFQTLDYAFAQADKGVAPVLKSMDEAGCQIENASQIIEQSLI